MKTIITAVLAVLLIAGTALSHEQEETTFIEALTQKTISEALISAAYENAATMGFEGLSVQAVEDELQAALDNWQSIVVESCATDWHSAVTVWFMLNIAVLREIDAGGGDELIDAMAGASTLVSYYETNATVACNLGG